MPMYQYRCRGCGAGVDQYAVRSRKSDLDIDMQQYPCRCGGIGFKPFYGTVRFGAVMHEHYSPATGTNISDPKHFDRDVRRLEEEASLRTGIPTTYTQVDPTDRDALGVTDEGLKGQHDGRVKRGEIAPTPKLL